MKTSLLVMGVISLAACLHGQTTNQTTAAPQVPASGVPKDTPYAIVHNEANSRTWERTTYEKLPSGQAVPHIHRVEELATGMNYKDANGNWIESKAQIERVPNGGAQAVHGQHQVYFPSDIYNGVIELVTSDGEHLQSRPLGISYFDGTNSVLIAELTNSIGQIISSNQVIYTNAFTDFSADLLCTYRRSGFECDLVFRSRPPAPEIFGLNSANTRLELLTEFFNTPEPEQTTLPSSETPLTTSAGSLSASAANVPDTTLQFGEMTMIRGKAFVVNVAGDARQSPGQAQAGPSENDIPVSKTWTKLDGRTFLIEEVPVPDISPSFQSLPDAVITAAPSPTNNVALHRVSNTRLLPPSRIAQAGPNAVHFAKARMSPKPGVVLDYNIVNSQNDMTFRGDTTYYVADNITLSGTTTIEGGTVIKYDTNYVCSLYIGGTLRCLTTPYHPAVFTSISDTSVGENFTGPGNSSCTGTLNLNVVNDLSQDLTYSILDENNDYLVDFQNVGAGSSGSYSFTAGLGQHLFFDATGSDSTPYNSDFYPSLQNGTMEVFSDGSMSYSETGSSLCTPPVISATALALANGGSLHDLIIRYVGIGISSGASYSVTNVQFVGCQTAAFEIDNTSLYAGNVLISGTGVAFHGYHFSAQAEQLTCDNGTDVAYSTSGTSSLALTNALITGVSSWGNTTVSTNEVVKLSSASGIYQTAGGGSYYLATNSPYRSIGSTNINASLLASLSHKTTYPPMVYSNITISTNVEFGPRGLADTGAAPDLGFHYNLLDYCFGGVTADGNVTFDAGTVVGYFETVYANGYGLELGNHVTNTFDGTFSSPCVFARYSTVQEGNANWLLKGSLAGIATVGNSSYFGQINANFTHCYGLVADPNHFRDYYAQLNVKVNNCEFYGASLEGYWLGLCATNCLFDRVINVGADPASGGLFWRNCTMHGGTVYAIHSGSPYWQVWIENCVFDGTGTNMDNPSAGNTNIIYCDYNGFVNGAHRLVISGSHDQVISNFTWQTGPLGNWYQPTTSSLINTGSVTADIVGLYHFTTQTNQAKETNSIVDMGYHYLALDSSGNPDDTDGDGLPDYVEDPNGNGHVDSGESSWLLGIDSQPQSQNVVQGQDVTFSVVAAGATPFSYQWRSNGTDIAGATGSSFTNLVVTTNDEANYSVVITNWTGSLTSSVATLTVNAKLEITTQPASQTAVQGANVSFTVGISGNHPAYQWYTNGVKINNGGRFSGATTSTLNISSVAVADQFNYTVKVTNLFNSVTSSNASLLVLTKPAISSGPTNTTAIQSDDVTLSAIITGGDLFYQWWLTNSLGTNSIVGATNTLYTKLVVLTNDAGHYSLVITNLAGSTNVNADLTVLVPPWITQQPATPVLTNQGSNVTFSISAFGTTNLYYQWYKNGSNAIANATNSSLTLNNVQPSDAAGYSAVVTNIAGTNVSAWAWLSIQLTGGGTTNGWGGGSSPPNGINISMIDPTNSSPTNPAVYLYRTDSPPVISIRASVFSQYSYITNVAFYFTGTNYTTNFMLAGTATPGANTKFALAWTNALPGTNILKARAWDCSGKTNDSGLVYVIMDQAPKITTTPSAKTIVWEGYNTNVWFTNYVWDDGLPYAITNISWSIPSGVTTSNIYTYTSSNIIIATDATFTNSGKYTLQITVSDGFTNSSSSCDVTIQHRPIVIFNSPTNNSKILIGTAFDLIATATDPDGAVAGVTFYTNTDFVLGEGVPSVSSTYKYPWGNAPLGTTLVSAVATDNDGLSSTSSVAVIVVPPLTVQFVSPTNNQLFVSSPTQVLLDALPVSYVGSTVTSVVFTNLSQSIYLGAGTLTNSDYQMWWTNATNGTYEVSVTARDNSGNLASNGVTITLNAMPLVSITIPATNLESFLEVTNVSITAMASDPDGTVTNVQFYDAMSGTNAFASVTNTPYTVVYSNRVAGRYAITAVATDNRGAQTVSELRVFKVASTNTPPSVIISYPTNGETFANGSDITIEASVTNGTGNVTNVEFFVNGTSIGSDPDEPYAITECCWKPGTYRLMALASDDRGSSSIFTNVEITIIADLPAAQGFWDSSFHTTNSVYENYAPADECGDVVNFGSAMQLTVYGTNIYVASADSVDGGAPDRGLSSLYQSNGSNWIRWGTAHSPDVTCPANFPFQEQVGGVAVNQSGIFLGGADITNDQYVIRQWDGSSWNDLSSDTFTINFVNNAKNNQDQRGITGAGAPVPKLQFIGGDLYLFGDFVDDAHTNIQFLAKWNTNSAAWEQVGSSLNEPVYALTALNGNLVVGGMFTNAGGNTNASYIAELVDGQWQDLGSGIGGTDFSTTGSTSTNFPGAVFSLAVCSSNLFVGGDFTRAGDQTNANGIAEWDGRQWKSIGNGLISANEAIVSTFPSFASFWDCSNAIVYTISTHGNVIYVGGKFTDALNPDGTDVPAASIAKATWNENEQEWTWSALDGGIWYQQVGQTNDLVSTIWGTAIMPGPSPGMYDVVVAGEATAYQGFQQRSPYYGISRWRVGYPQPPGPPQVTITNPPNAIIYSNVPSSIEFYATATSSYTSINDVQFYVDGTQIGPGSWNGGDSYIEGWSPTPGFHYVTAEATDVAGLKTISQPVVVHIVDTNSTVTAIDDEFFLTVNDPPTVLNVLSNDFSSVSNKLRVISVAPGMDFFFHPAIGNARVSVDGSSIIYTPKANVYGTEQYVYGVSDGVSTNYASITIKVREKPFAVFEHPDDGSATGTNVNVPINGVILDFDSSVTNFSLFVNGSLLSSFAPTNINYSSNPTNFFFPMALSEVSPETSYSYFTNNWSTNQPGYYTFTATMTDAHGYSNVSSPVTIVITNTSTGTNVLMAHIGNLQVSESALGDPEYVTVHNGFFDLQGTASDSNSGDNVLYQVLVHPLGDPSTVLANATPQPRDSNGFHSSPSVSDGNLGLCDFSSIPNGVYDIELVVRGGGAETNDTSSFRLESDLKIGQFSFSEQDLVLPVNGIPITITRTYNSLNPDTGPFGVSWSFAVNDMDVQLDDQRTPVTVGNDSAFEDSDTTQNGPPQVLNMRTGGGWDVTLTLPDGRRVTFPFEPSFPWPDGHAAWGHPQGVTAKLEAANPSDDDINFIDSGNISTPVWDNSDSSYFPAPFAYQDFPGWILTTADGTKYHITPSSTNNISCEDPNNPGKYVTARVCGPPKLTEIDEPSTNKIVINDSGIFNYDATNAVTPTRWALFERDSAGRIRAIHDPNGGSNGLPVVEYVYNNDTGNLIQVLKLVDRNAGIYTTNKYYYDNPNFPHYITSIENGDGIPVAQNNYDDSGRLISVQDANGTMTYFNHGTNNSEVVVDRLEHTNTYVYDSQGNVIWATNALGQVTATAYTDSNFPTLKTAETNAYGTAQATWTLYAYDQNGNQTNVVSMGHTNSFTYDGTGNLLTQVDPLGNVTKNLYDETGNLTNSAQYEANNHLITQSSSIFVDGKLVETLNANGLTNATFGYDEFGNLTNTTDANGFTRSFAYDANGNQTNSTYQWTPPGGGASQTVTNTTVYDASGRVTVTIDGLGNTNQTFYNAIGKVDYTIDKFGNTNSFVYDALGNLIQTTYPNGTSTQTAYDAAGRAYLTEDRNGITGTRTDYDAAGRATNTVRLTNVVISVVYNGSVAESEVDSAGTPISTNSTVYDAAGRVTSRTSPDGTTSYSYYPDGQLMQTVDALNETNSYAYDAAGRQTNAVDALNHATSFQYDAVGRMIATVYNNNTATTNVFDNLGQRTQTVDQAKLVTQFGYSLSGQLTNVLKPSVPDPETGISSTNAEWSYLYDSYGHPMVTIDPKGRGTTNFFDAYSRQFSQRLPMNQTNLVEYNSLGQVVTNFDFKGQYTIFGYDRFGRLKTKCFFTSTGNLSNSVCYVYDNLDRIRNITECYGADATTNCLAFLGPLWRHPSGPESRAAKAWAAVKATGPKWGGPLVAFAILCWLLSLPAGRKLRQMLAWYYLRGGWRLNVAAVCDRRTKRLRLPSLFWRVVTVLIIGVFIADDPSWNNLFTARADCSIPSTDSTLTTRITNFVYDPEGHLTQVNSPEGVINYDYDLATGRLTSTCTANSRIGYAYDALARLKTVTVFERNGSDLTIPETNTYHYDAVGNRSEVDLPNGVVTSYRYDSLNRLTNLVHQFGTTNLATYSYKLDPTGRRTNAVEILLQEAGAGYLTNTLSWKFDGMYRLTNEVSITTSTGAPYAYTNNFTYNLAGNRLHKVRIGGGAETIDYSYDANDELLYETNGATVASYLYDANGSMTNRATGTTNYNYAYDLKNKLSSFGLNGTIQASYQYNDQGIRVRATSGGTTNYYLIDANNHTGYQQILEEYTGLRGTPTKSYVIGDDVLAQTVSGTVSYLLYDGHGSTRQTISGSTGAVSSHYNYEAYGITQTATSTSTAETSMLYCGEQYDSTLQMYNLRARYYNPANGTFNQRDTFAGNNFDPQSLHKYSYCQDDPILNLDRNGYAITGEDIVGVLAVSGILLTVVSFVNHSRSYGYDVYYHKYSDAFQDLAEAMVDLTSLGTGGGGSAGTSPQLAYVGQRLSQNAAGLLRAGMPPASVWGYVSMTASSLGSETQGGDSVAPGEWKVPPFKLNPDSPSSDYSDWVVKTFSDPQPPSPNMEFNLGGRWWEAANLKQSPKSVIDAKGFQYEFLLKSGWATKNVTREALKRITETAKVARQYGFKIVWKCQEQYTADYFRELVNQADAGDVVTIDYAPMPTPSAPPN